jgi:ankyrin repeat protein
MSACSNNGDDEVWASFRRLYTSDANTVRWLQVFLRVRGDRGAFRSSRAVDHIDAFAAFHPSSADDHYKYSVWLGHLQGPPQGRFSRWEPFVSSGDANDFLPSLHVAAFFDFAELVKSRLESGADANQLSVDYQAPLHLAARGDAVASGQLLIQHGGNLNALGWAGNTPLMWAIDVECYTTSKRSGPFHMAAVLLDAGADPNVGSPLSSACGMPRPDDPFLLDLVRSLLESGGTKGINGHPDSDPPLSLAVKQNAGLLAKLLLNYGADPNGGPNVNIVQRSRRYPLIAALQVGCNATIVRTLLEVAADPNAADPGVRQDFRR